jgi:hypothetical protein
MDGNAQEFFNLATEIANGAMAEARKEPEDAETCALLLDIVELFHPVLVAGGGQREGTWQTRYDRILVLYNQTTTEQQPLPCFPKLS